MPPSWASSRRPFDSFVPAMQQVLGVTGVGLDKELFSIRRSPTPSSDCARGCSPCDNSTDPRALVPRDALASLRSGGQRVLNHS
jgi:hypothetical protein